MGVVKRVLFVFVLLAAPLTMGSASGPLQHHGTKCVIHGSSDQGKVCILVNSNDQQVDQKEGLAQLNVGPYCCVYAYQLRDIRLYKNGVRVRWIVFDDYLVTNNNEIDRSTNWESACGSNDWYANVRYQIQYDFGDPLTAEFNENSNHWQGGGCS